MITRQSVDKVLTKNSMRRDVDVSEPIQFTNVMRVRTLCLLVR